VRDQFSIWYPRTAAEHQRFIADGLVSLDTNVLIHLYRLTPDVRSDILALFRRLGDRLWISHQVGTEFHQNRFNVIKELEETERKLRTAVAEAAARLDNTISGFRDHPAIDKTELRKTVAAGFADIKSYIDEVTRGSYLSVQAAIRSDDVLDSITDLLDGKVGTPYSDERMRELEEEADKRFKELIPPGYEDAKKKDGRRYGDYVLWRQLIDEAVKRKVPVLFVTNDQKDDWYRRVDRFTVGPRHELVTEMQREAGVDFHLQTFALFVDTAPTYLSTALNEATVTEVSRLEEFDQASSMADRASEIAARKLATADSDSDQHSKGMIPAHVEFADMEIARLQARRTELQSRLAELESAIEMSSKSDEPNQPTDPRSYSRALETRIEVTTNLLTNATERLAELQGLNARSGSELG
jgi:hypothetical protein